MSTDVSEFDPANGVRRCTELEGFLLSLLRLASVLNESAIFSDHGIGLAEWAMLTDIGATPVRLAELSRRMRLSRQRVRILIKELENKGLLHVAGSTEGDRRSRTISATPRAAEVLQAITAKLESLDLPAKGNGLPRATKFTHSLLRTLRQTKKRQGATAAGR
jgi:DNA-binding MarR family transcriptional regulator